MVQALTCVFCLIFYLKTRRFLSDEPSRSLESTFTPSTPLSFSLALPPTLSVEMAVEKSDGVRANTVHHAPTEGGTFQRETYHASVGELALLGAVPHLCVCVCGWVGVGVWVSE